MPIFSASCVGVGSITSLYFHSQILTNDSATNCSSPFALYNYNPCKYNILNLYPKSTIKRYPLQAAQINASSGAEVDEFLNDSPLPSESPRQINDSSGAEVDEVLNDSPLPSESPGPIQSSADWEEAKRYKETGTIYEGRVKGFNRGGLRVCFYSLVGFLPFRALSPSHACKEPDKTIQKIARGLIGSLIPMKVIDVDEESKKLIFSEKDATWANYIEKVKVGDVFDGRVGFVESYGAVVYLCFPDGNYHLYGFVHISEVSWDHVQDVRDVLSKGDNVRVKVARVDRKRSRISLSLRQLEADPLFESLHKVIHQQDVATSPDATSADESYDVQPLPGLEEILNELLKEDGISELRIRRQGFEKRVVSQDLQLWLSNAPAVNNQSTILARAGRQVQEIQLTTTLDQDGIKKALQRVLERVP